MFQFIFHYLWHVFDTSFITCDVCLTPLEMWEHYTAISDILMLRHQKGHLYIFFIYIYFLSRRLVTIKSSIEANQISLCTLSTYISILRSDIYVTLITWETFPKWLNYNNKILHHPLGKMYHHNYVEIHKLKTTNIIFNFYTILYQL